MKAVSSLAPLVFCCAGLLLAVGCGKPATSRSREQAPGEVEHLCFAPAKIRVSPLTQLTLPTSPDEMTRIRVYVVLLDPFESYLKAPGTFRFELYGKVLRSAKPKGKRIHQWDDLDLRSAATNNEYWQEVLHAYEIDLEFDSQKDKGYILEVTFTLPDNQRLTAEYGL